MAIFTAIALPCSLLVLIRNLHQTLTKFTAEETKPLPHKIHSLALTSKGFVASHNVYHPVDVISAGPLR